MKSWQDSMGIRGCKHLVHKLYWISHNGTQDAIMWPMIVWRQMMGKYIWRALAELSWAQCHFSNVHVCPLYIVIVITLFLVIVSKFKHWQIKIKGYLYLVTYILLCLSYWSELTTFVCFVVYSSVCNQPCIDQTMHCHLYHYLYTFTYRYVPLYLNTF